MMPKGLKKLVLLARSREASDIHICPGAPILFRIGDDLVAPTGGVVTEELCHRMLDDILSPEQMEQFRADGDYDMVLVDEEGGRCRVNVAVSGQVPGLVIRLLTDTPKSIEELRLPPIIKKLSEHTKGLILITGSTNSGKTTTMSAMIDEINTHRARHIVTIEDPVETLHTNKMSLIRQREVGRDTESFYRGLRAGLRQDPDVLAIGEMRDYETIRTALIAAETGVLVLSTLHIISIDKLIERFLSYAPAEDQSHLRYLLADALQGVVHQELLPTVDDSKRVACEVLIGTDAVRNIIRSRDTFHLRNTIRMGAKYGMITMRQSVDSLVKDGLVDEEIAERVLADYI